MRLPILDGNELLDDIVGYLDVLNREYRVSVHGVEQVLGPYFQRLLPYNTHTHPACLYVFHNQDSLRHCPTPKSKGCHARLLIRDGSPAILKNRERYFWEFSSLSP